MNKSFAFFIVFTAGIAVTSLEISSARLAAPFFGSTIYVWGGAIGTVLFSLAIGYWLGGKIVDTYNKKTIVSVVLLTAAISTEVIPLLYVPVNNYLVHVANNWHSPIGIVVIVSMIVLFFIPLVCLGMISPIILRLSLAKIEEVGSWSGLLSSGATLGSIIGTFLSAFWTIPYYGTRATIVGAGIALLLLALSTTIIQRKAYLLTALCCGLSALYTAFTPYIPRKNIVWAKESPYQYVQVIEKQGQRFLLHDAAQASQSSYQPSDPNSTSPYDIFGVLPYLALADGSQRSVLILGMGGGNIVHSYQRLLNSAFDFDITAVEIDPDVIRAAREMFDLQSAEVKVHIADARQYLRSDHHTYDIIIVDAYTHEMQIPPMLATREFFHEIQQRLKPDGVLGMNAFVVPGARYFGKLTSTLASVFPDVRDVTFTPDSINHLLMAGQKIDVGRLPEKIAPRIDIDLASLIQRMTRITKGGDFYTDDRTDLDIRVRPFIDQRL